MERDLHRAGCRCTPTITSVPVATPLVRDLADGRRATLAALVEHSAGCPLGDRMLPANRRGIVPGMLGTPESRCER